jgi:hypothetical protein
MKESTLETIAEGVAPELFAHELAKIAANICDENTPADTERSITLKFTFTPDDAREECKVKVEATSKLAGVKPFSKTVWVGKRNGKPTLYGQNTKQTSFFDEGTIPLQEVNENA